MSRPRLLDLFCGAGGAAMGYHRAGFEVVGIDRAPQPNYPFGFVRGGALSAWTTILGPFDAIHASPPCQRFSSATRISGRPDGKPDLIAQVRELLQATGLPYVLENVVGAPLVEPMLLCGSTFGLDVRCTDGRVRQLRRHRLFETSWPLKAPPPCRHTGEPLGVYGDGGPQRQTVWKGGHNRGYMADRVEARKALGIGWMKKRELNEAIPPAYTEWIGRELLRYLETRAAA